MFSGSVKFCYIRVLSQVDHRNCIDIQCQIMQDLFQNVSLGLLSYKTNCNGNEICYKDFVLNLLCLLSQFHVLLLTTLCPGRLDLEKLQKLGSFVLWVLPAGFSQQEG